MTDTQIIYERMQAGDRRAFDHFFERQSARILVYINYNMGQRLRKKIDPGDILQNVYLKLYKNFEAFQGRADRRGIQPTLIRMADHEITEAYRYHFKVDKRDARREVTAAFLKAADGEQPDLLSWVPSDATSVSARVARHDEYQRVMEMLRRLDPLEQCVTVARIIEGVSAQEIAERLGKSRGAIHMIIARARDKLRQVAGADDKDAEEEE